MNKNNLKKLNILNKVVSNKISDLRSKINECLSEIDRMNLDLRTMMDDRVNEEMTASEVDNAEKMYVIGAYRSKQKNNIDEVSKSIEEKEQLYENLSAELRDFFFEQKSYEIMIDDFKTAQYNEMKREEMNFFDELSIQKWNRR